MVLGLLGIYALIVWQRHIADAQQAALDKQKADFQSQLDDIKNSKQVTIAPTNTDERNVYFATQPVEAGAKISPAFFEKKLTPNDLLPDAYTPDTDIVGFFAIRKIEKGDPLTPRNIGKSLPFITQRITPGMRAISLQVFNAEFNATGGFVVDGDKVDLLYTTLSNDNKELTTQTVMQNVPVLYVPGSPVKTDKSDGINPVPAPGGAISVTFEVTPEEAQALVFLSGTNSGKFSMILRSRRDTMEAKIKPFDVRDYDFNNLKKVQRTVDKSTDRVDELTKEIEAKEKALQGTTNETTTPTPPSP